jgi:hypothetical protein
MADQPNHPWQLAGQGAVAIAGEEPFSAGSLLSLAEALLV